ncbi:hypothetical protein [Haloferax sp. KTX1]|nr:hypothetical protein [Haloferax sp. KTX1]
MVEHVVTDALRANKTELAPATHIALRTDHSPAATRSLAFPIPGGWEE